MGDVTVAVHQPNYLPWLGFFNKIARSDIFILLDTVQFARRGYTHRVHLFNTRGDPHWITQSVRRQQFEQEVIHQMHFADMYWADKHLRTFKQVYHKSPYFEAVFAVISEHLSVVEDHLSTMNGNLIRAIARSVGLSTRILYASEMEIGPFHTPSERIARLARHVGAQRYLSGAGGRAYNDPQVFDQYGIELMYSSFPNKPYPQVYPGVAPEFVAGLSVVDALFNLGFDGVADLLMSPGEPGLRMFTSK